MYIKMIEMLHSDKYPKNRLNQLNNSISIRRDQVIAVTHENLRHR